MALASIGSSCLSRGRIFVLRHQGPRVEAKMDALSGNPRQRIFAKMENIGYVTAHILGKFADLV